MTPDEMREALAAAFMHEGTFCDLQANDDWGYAAADLALTVVAGECTCPLAPVVYEGPQEDCEVHGERRSVLIGQRDEARAALEAAQAENKALWDQVHRDQHDAMDARAAVERVRALHPDPHWCCTPDGGNFVFGSGHGSQPMPCPTVAALDGEPGDKEEA